MSRPLRILSAGLTYHVGSRGNGRMVIFRDDVDRLRFYQLLADMLRDQRVLCHADAQMETHYHLVVTTEEPNLSAAIKQLNGDYAQWWNKRHGHVGHVFQGRFFSQVVQDETYLLVACRYVVLNPVRGRLVASPDQWRWSSYRATAGLSPVPDYLSPGKVWRAFADEPDAAVREYRAFVTSEWQAPSLPSDPVLGDDQFLQRFADARRNASREVPKAERVSLPPLDDLFTLAVTRADRVAAILDALSAGYTTAAIARYLGVQPITVRRTIAATGARPTE